MYSIYSYCIVKIFCFIAMPFYLCHAINYEEDEKFRCTVF